ncbi:MAG: hypothetical protein EO766_00610 [Hydrotalea sp. AMD]|uniref:MutS-related protein n=1 Tax=Hydrotalea sp. AMD TaxID=2501297 RepID=UPI000944214C|nr:hypothetical protein [Hydrotalea sp. AMD]RWZ90698.1 MAG: hypothetical protein EO766_00610 [Hydrotalea sp. AMD]
MSDSIHQLQVFYQNKIQDYTLAVHRLKNKINAVAFFRAIFFVAWLYLLYQYFTNNNQVILLLSFLGLAGFLALISIHFNFKNKKQICQNKLWLAQNEWNVLDEKDNAFDDGNEFFMNTAYYADLDIFGKKSLFHLLNRTTTYLGKQVLFHQLSNPMLQKEKILLYQSAIKTYSTQYSIIETWIATAMLYKNDETVHTNGIQQWITNFTSLTGRTYWNSIRYILPALSIVAFIYTLDTGNYAWLSICIVLNWLHVGIAGKYNGKAFATLGKQQEVLNTYSKLLDVFKNVSVNDAVVLQQLKEKANEGCKSIVRLSFIANLIHQRFNLLATTLLNSLLMYDVHCTVLLDNWHHNNKNKINAWLEAIGEIEYLNSMALFAYNHPAFVYPEIETEGFIIKAANLGHPMISGKQLVKNSFQLQQSGVLLITGSNMSGKSTFLRTVGINILLAEIGAPICATQFSFTPMYLFTCIRISDSLQENTSYFMAELQKLADIKTQLSTRHSALILIDEILRGTNSCDKYEGSVQFILQLIQQPCIVLFATHDLKLSSLEEMYPNNITNYCFESTIENNHLSFDYVLRKGIAQNKNATFLMKKMGII